MSVGQTFPSQLPSVILPPGVPGSPYRIVGIGEIPGVAYNVGPSNGTGTGISMRIKMPITTSCTDLQFWAPSFRQTLGVLATHGSTNDRPAAVRMALIMGGAASQMESAISAGAPNQMDFLNRVELTPWGLGMIDRWKLSTPTITPSGVAYASVEVHGNRGNPSQYLAIANASAARGERTGGYGAAAAGNLLNQNPDFLNPVVTPLGGQPQIGLVPIGIPSGAHHGIWYLGTSRTQGGSDADAAFAPLYSPSERGYLRAVCDLAQEGKPVAALNLGVTGLQSYQTSWIGLKVPADSEYPRVFADLVKMAASAGPHMVFELGANDGAFNATRMKECILTSLLMARDAQIAERKGGRLIVVASAPICDCSISRAAAQGLTISGANTAARYASLIALNPTRTQYIESQDGSGADGVRTTDWRFWTLGTGGGYSTTGYSVTITGSASVTGGTWGISVFGTRVNFAFNANATTIKAGIDAVLPAGTTCTVTGGPFNTSTPVVITYSNAPASVLHNPFRLFFENLTPTNSAHVPAITACTATIPQCIPGVIIVDEFGAIAAQRSNLEWVFDKKDTGEASTSAGGYTTVDGVHPTTAGYLSSKDAFKAAINGIINGTL